MPAVAGPTEFFSWLAEATEMPVTRATSRTPLPVANNCFALSTFAIGIGGRPHLIESARAAARHSAQVGKLGGQQSCLPPAGSSRSRDAPRMMANKPDRTVGASHDPAIALTWECGILPIAYMRLWLHTGYRV